MATLVVSLILYHFGTKQGGGVVKNTLFNETHDTISKDFTFYLSLIVHTSIDLLEKDQPINTGKNAQGETDKHLYQKNVFFSGIAQITSTNTPATKFSHFLCTLSQYQALVALLYVLSFHC